MRYSHRPSAGEVEVVGSGASPDAERLRGSARSSLPPCPPRGTFLGQGSALAAKREVLEAVLTWSGGAGIDLVKLVVDGAFRRPHEARLESGRQRLAVELEVDARPAHTVELLVAFVGESRAKLSLRVYLDGVHVGGSECEHASQRWEALWTGP